MTAKNIISYILILLLGLPLRIISLVFYPLVFLFRHKVLAYMNKRVIEDDVNRVFVLKPGYKKWKIGRKSISKNFLIYLHNEKDNVSERVY